MANSGARAPEFFFMSKSPNLSPVSFEKWLELIFNCRVSRANSHPLRTDFRVSDKSRVVAHMTRCCREFKAVSQRFTRRQMDRGIWFLLSCDFNFGEYLADPEIDLQARLDCVRAMVHPYSNYVAQSRVHVMENCFEMWWDLLCSRFWSAHLWRIKRDEQEAEWNLAQAEQEEDTPQNRRIAAFFAGLDQQRDFNEQLDEAGLADEILGNTRPPITISYQEIEPDEARVADAMLDTLTQILYLEEQRCVYYALHGLNHLEHPRGAAVVQAFIDRHKSEWTPEGLAYVESCRDGTAM